MSATVNPPVASHHLFEELDYRDNHGIEVSLLWHRADNSLIVFACDTRTNESFEISVDPAQAREVFLSIRVRRLNLRACRLDVLGKTEAAGQRGIGEEGDLVDFAAAQGEHDHAPRFGVQVVAEGRLAVGAGRA